LILKSTLPSLLAPIRISIYAKLSGILNGVAYPAYAVSFSVFPFVKTIFALQKRCVLLSLFSSSSLQTNAI